MKNETNTDKQFIRLSPRLKKIARLVPSCRCAADIGTDHAYIPVYLVKNGIAESAIASDIQKGPINRARKNVLDNMCGEKISVRLGAGLETISENEADVVIIAGMGGLLIADILEKSMAVAKNAKKLILQPMTAIKELREYLNSNGYFIESESLVREENKLYTILSVCTGTDEKYTQKELYLGKRYDEEARALYTDYCTAVTTKLKKRLSGLESSKNPKNDNEIKHIKKLLTEIES